MWVRRALSSLPREVIDCDVCIVGGGPAGLAAAIKLKQIDAALEVCVLEKAAEIGAHIVSGNVFEPRALDELIHNWRSLGSPVRTPVSRDRVLILTETSAVQVPSILVPSTLNNEGNYIVSLSEVCRWLGSYAEGLGVAIYPGFAAAEVLYSQTGFVTGVATGDFGVGKDGQPKANFQRGVEVKAKQTLFAEGCRGSLSEKLISRFRLRDYIDEGRKVSLQTYGIGIKEVWEVKPENFKSGLVVHTAGWPLTSDVYGGGFAYHMQPNLVHVGLVIALDYTNPYFSPYQELQRYKTHPEIRQFLQGGECVAYAARSVNEGGYDAVPKLTFPGGALIGCSAGFLNTAKIKGSHTAMKSGMLAAEAVAETIRKGDSEGAEPAKYQHLYKKSWVCEELKASRHYRSSFNGNLWAGMVKSWLSGISGSSVEVSERKAVPDYSTTQPARSHKPIPYPKPDHKLTFDLLTNLTRTNTNHAPDQPCHLKIKPGHSPSSLFKTYNGPETRFCPAGVYEFINGDLQINAQNCIHCKACDIKAPGNYIEWTVPEGGGGPFYSKT